MSLRLLLSQPLQFRNVLARVAAHVANPHRQPVPHADNAKLRDRVLLEELGHELGCIPYCKQVSVGAEVLFGHSGREVDD